MFNFIDRLVQTLNIMPESTTTQPEVKTSMSFFARRALPQIDPNHDDNKFIRKMSQLKFQCIFEEGRNFQYNHEESITKSKPNRMTIQGVNLELNSKFYLMVLDGQLPQKCQDLFETVEQLFQHLKDINEDQIRLHEDSFEIIIRMQSTPERHIIIPFTNQPKQERQSIHLKQQRRFRKKQERQDTSISKQQWSRSRSRDKKNKKSKNKKNKKKSARYMTEQQSFMKQEKRNVVNDVESTILGVSHHKQDDFMTEDNTFLETSKNLIQTENNKNDSPELTFDQHSLFFTGRKSSEKQSSNDITDPFSLIFSGRQSAKKLQNVIQLSDSQIETPIQVKKVEKVEKDSVQIRNFGQNMSMGGGMATRYRFVTDQTEQFKRNFSLNYLTIKRISDNKQPFMVFGREIFPYNRKFIVKFEISNNKRSVQFGFIHQEDKTMSYVNKNARAIHLAAENNDYVLYLDGQRYPPKNEERTKVNSTRTIELELFPQFRRFSVYKNNDHMRPMYMLKLPRGIRNLKLYPFFQTDEAGAAVTSQKVRQHDNIHKC